MKNAVNADFLICLPEQAFFLLEVWKIQPTSYQGEVGRGETWWIFLFYMFINR